MSLATDEPVCSVCRTDESDVWERTENGILCHKCTNLERSVNRHRDPSRAKQSIRIPIAAVQESNSEGTTRCVRSSSDITVSALQDRRSSNNSRSTAMSTSDSKTTTRKSLRIKPGKGKSQSAVKAQTTKGRSRRVIFKKNPSKTISSSATAITSDFIFYRGTYWQVGDVVSVVDRDDDALYYAQLRGFLEDEFNEKSAVVTWLVPTRYSPPNEFDASSYVLGPEEEIPRKMKYFEFVCHAPSDYFYCHNSPYATLGPASQSGVIWTGLKSTSRHHCSPFDPSTEQVLSPVSSADREASGSQKEVNCKKRTSAREKKIK